MAISNRNEVSLNSIIYPLKGKVHPSLVSVMPQKIVTGDYTAASNPLASSWVTSDMSGGIGVQELDEDTQASRVWWADANIRYKASNRLADLDTTITMPLWTAAGWSEAKTWADPGSDWTDEAKAIDGSTATLASVTDAASSDFLYLYIPTISCSKIQYYFGRNNV